MVNGDGALAQSGKAGGGGVVMRDHNGKFLAGASHFFPSTSGPEQAELLASRRAIQVASEGGVGKIVLETVCQCPVGVQSERSLNRSVNGPLIEEIKTLLGYFDNYAI